MPIDIVQTVLALGNTTSSPTTVTFNVGPKAGHLIGLGFTLLTTGTITSVTDTQNNNYIEVASLASGSNGGLMKIYQATAVGGTVPNVITIAWSGAARVLAYAAEYSGPFHSTIADATGSQDAAGSSLSYTLTNAVANELVISINGRNGGGVNWSALTGTDYSGVASAQFEFNSFLASTSGTSTITATASGSGIGGLSASFRPLLFTTALPGTYTPQQALDVARRMVHGIPTSALQARVADVVNSEIWLAFPWRWTLGTLTAVTLSDGVQDYANTHSDFQRFVHPRLAQTNLSPIEYREIGVKEYLGVELTRKGSIESIRNVAYLPVDNKFRLDFSPVITSPTVVQLQGYYQVKPTRITDSNLTAVYTNPDQYFNVHVEGMKYWFYQLNDDPRAGTVVIARDGRKQYTGQMGAYYDALQQMMMNEDASDGQTFMWPEDPLGNKMNQSAWFPGL